MPVDRQSAEPAPVPPTFENAMERLEAVVEQMENSKLPLEELIRCYEEGTRLIKVCSERLSAAEQRIEIITRDRRRPAAQSSIIPPPTAVLAPAAPPPKSSKGNQARPERSRGRPSLAVRRTNTPMKLASSEPVAVQAPAHTPNRVCGCSIRFSRPDDLKALPESDLAQLGAGKSARNSSTS